MRIKVKQKNGGANSPFWVTIIITIIFFSVGSAMMFFSLLPWLEDMTFYIFMKTFAKNGILTLFGFGFFLFSLLFFSYMVRPCKKYIAILESCRREQYNGKEVYFYKFKLKYDEDSIFNEYDCYTKTECDFKENEMYYLGIKQLNWEARYVELIEDELDDNELERREKFKPVNGLLYVYAFILMIFGGGFLFVIFYTIYEASRGKKIISDIIGLVIIGLVVAYILYVGISLFKDDGTVEDRLDKEEQRQLKMLGKRK